MKAIAAFILLAAVTVNASAALFNAPVAGKSTVTFVSKQMGVGVTGSFGQFASQISFDPTTPETGKAKIDVSLASIDAGSGDANDEVKGKAWFNVKEFPTATFVSTSLKALGANRYQATGKLTIKGKIRDVVVPFTATPAGFTLVLDGAIPISRAQFGIGEGAWADPSVVADEVQVRFHFILGAAK